MSSEIAIKVEGLSKCYQIYDQPRDRLKQFVLPRLHHLIARQQRKYYREFWALRDVSFDVKKGETVGIVGRNGSGKSTLLQLITGTLAPTSGLISTNGRIAALLELGSGFNPEFTGRENVYLNGSILGLSRAEVDERFDRIAGFADIGEFIDSPVKQYSSGMFARLAFSVAINVDPEILIVDEILSVGDAAFQRRCLSKFYNLRETGCTILFVSHDQYQVKSVCQRAVYLERGVQKMFGPAGRVIDSFMVDMEAAEAERVDMVTAASEAVVAETDPVPEVAPSSDSQIAYPYVIESVRLVSTDGEDVEEVATGDDLVLVMKYRALTPVPPEQISFVFNLYRHDGFYICGTTTLMDGIAAHKGSQHGQVSVRFPSFPLLSGRYQWRVAINDHGGFSVLAEAKNVCIFSVVDNFNAVGIVDLEREWLFEIG